MNEELQSVNKILIWDQIVYIFINLFDQCHKDRTLFVSTMKADAHLYDSLVTSPIEVTDADTTATIC